MRLLYIALGWVLGLLLVCWRRTCRYRVVNDPRPRLRDLGRPYIYALLHAHQVAAVFVNDEERLAAMVSRSRDGDLLVPSLSLRRVQAARGSTSKRAQDRGAERPSLSSATCSLPGPRFSSLSTAPEVLVTT